MFESGLAGAAFSDPGIYTSESERLFRERWISVTTGQLVPETGSVFPCTIAGLSLLVVRDRDEQVRVYYNMCRHRGAPLVDRPCKTGLLTCPYHAWTYDLDGRLYRAPWFDKTRDWRPDDKASEDLGLIELRSAVWRDIVFINVDGKARPFDEFIAPLDQRLADWSADELVPVGNKEYEIAANWKLVAENFLDAYHLPYVHPELGDMDGALHTEDLQLGDDFVGFVMTEGYGEDSFMEDRDTPLFTSLPESRANHIEVWSIFPNTLILVEPDTQQVITARPQSAGITHESFSDYAPGLVGNEQEIREWLDFSQNVNDQDQVLLEKLQLSRSMPAGDQTRLNRNWDVTVARFQQAWQNWFSGLS